LIFDQKGNEKKIPPSTAINPAEGNLRIEAPDLVCICLEYFDQI
jgi:hypothetical protein